MTQSSLFAAEWKPAAIFGGQNDCYRYTLTRGVGHGTDAVNFIMLNPSTADTEKDDPTIRRCMGYAKEWGYADLIVTNLFAYRATDPSELRNTADPIGPENDRYILETAKKSNAVVCAWGIHGSYLGRSATVKRMLLDAGLSLACLKLCADGEPGHPLYLKRELWAVSYATPETTT
jgi:hypothetical protein